MEQGTWTATYNYPECGPWGITLKDQLTTNSRLNASFSQRAWEDAKQNGCLPAPCKPYPRWPPPARTGYVYPVAGNKKPQEVLDLGGSDFANDATCGGQPFIANNLTRPTSWPASPCLGASNTGCPQAYRPVAGSLAVYRSQGTERYGGSSQTGTNAALPDALPKDAGMAQKIAEQILLTPTEHWFNQPAPHLKAGAVPNCGSGKQ